MGGVPGGAADPGDSGSRPEGVSSPAPGRTRRAESCSAGAGGFIALDERLQVLLSNTLDRIDRARLQPRPEHQGRQASQYDNRKLGKSNKIAWRPPVGAPVPRSSGLANRFR